MVLADAPDFLTMEETAQILRIGRNQVYELARVWRATDGERGVPVVEFGRRLRVPKAALMRLPGWLSLLGPIVPADAGVYRLQLDDRALNLGYRLGSDTLLILLDLASHATDSPEGMVVAASYRDVARRLGVSKDTVGRRMAALRRVGVVVERAEHSVDRFEVRWYLLRPELAGVTRERVTVAA